MSALRLYEWIMSCKYLEQERLSACIYTNLGGIMTIFTLKREKGKN